MTPPSVPDILTILLPTYMPLSVKLFFGQHLPGDPLTAPSYLLSEGE